MSTKHTQRAPGSTGLIVILLALVALVGLLSGFLTHTLVSRGAAAAGVSPTSTTLAHATSSNTSTPVPSAGATGTVTASAVSGQFQLSVSVTPKKLKPGQQLTITVHAFTPDTHTPITGLPCTLRAPTDGSAGLFSTWPDTQTTNADGAASWTLTAPHEPAGTYEVEAYAKASAWSYRLDSTVDLSAS
ncbi:MAG TPA: hypothetical protein VID72_04915 [Ktedonobacterales bacterium]